MMSLLFLIYRFDGGGNKVQALEALKQKNLPRLTFLH